MRILAEGKEHKQDYYYCLNALKVMIFFFFIAIIYEAFFMKVLGMKEFWIVSIFSIFYFRIYYESLKEMIYSFWGLSIPFHLYLLYSLGFAILYEDVGLAGYIYLSLVVIHWIIFYIMLSPVYYPRIQWWEYDFRFRTDLKGIINQGNQPYECRLTDLRRGAGSVAVFSNLKLGEKAIFNCESFGSKYEFEIVTASMAVNVPGRGMSYGFRFILPNKEIKRKYNQFIRNWRLHVKKKELDRFKLVT